jgi:predicted nucleic acid-binding protein
VVIDTSVLVSAAIRDRLPVMNVREFAERFAPELIAV